MGTDRLPPSLTPKLKQSVVGRCYFLVVHDRERRRSVLWRVLRDELGPSRSLDERHDALLASRRSAWAEFERLRPTDADHLELLELAAFDLRDFQERFAELRVDVVNRWKPYSPR